MRYKFVKTSNYKTLATQLEHIKSAAKEARILLLTSEPGTGKSRCCNYWGSLNNAIYIKGTSGMNETFMRDFFMREMGIKAARKFNQHRAIQATLVESRQTIIFDEAQHGLDKKAEVIEYLRGLAEEAGCILVLVCHTSERHHFSEYSLAHIASRISSVVEFKPASIDDTALYLTDLCEVTIDAGIIKQAFDESRGRYRLLTSAINTLEKFAKTKQVSALTADDIKGFSLCEDAMKLLKKAK